jgi:lactate dehydrogenase-like 2-hydroxyacid dehydrogenase
MSAWIRRINLSIGSCNAAFKSRAAVPCGSSRMRVIRKRKSSALRRVIRRSWEPAECSSLRHLIEALPELRFISKFGVGVDNINLSAAAHRGILIANTPEDSEAVDVAEHTLGMILTLRKKTPAMDA